jgi:hypothetical protein
VKHVDQVGKGAQHYLESVVRLQLDYASQLVPADVLGRFASMETVCFPIFPCSWLYLVLNQEEAEDL